MIDTAIRIRLVYRAASLLMTTDSSRSRSRNEGESSGGDGVCCYVAHALSIDSSSSSWHIVLQLWLLGFSGRMSM